MTISDPIQSPRPRPTLGLVGSPVEEAEDAVELLVSDLQAGWDAHDADITDRRLGNDVLWGSPFGATVQGYARLHDIHIRLKQNAVGGPSSRFEVVQHLTPARGVVLAQVRRTALDERGHAVASTPDTRGPFSELALYVLVQHDNTWWVAAGQNTPISASASDPSKS